MLGQEVVLAKPQTYMNLSGEAVAVLKKKYSVETADVLVVHDDLDLPLGRIRLRERGASAGHKGIESIIACLGTRDFPRIRVGIGRPGEEAGHDIVGYVLGDFSREDLIIVRQVIGAAGEAIECFIAEGTVAAMNKFNGLDLRPPSLPPPGPPDPTRGAPPANQTMKHEEERIA